MQRRQQGPAERREWAVAQLLTILGLAISSNLDTLAVALAYGARKFRLPFVSNFICALIPCVGTYLTMLVGSTLRRFVSAQLAGILGAGIIVAAGAVLINSVSWKITENRRGSDRVRPTVHNCLSPGTTAALQPQGAGEHSEGPPAG